MGFSIPVDTVSDCFSQEDFCTRCNIYGLLFKLLLNFFLHVQVSGIVDQLVKFGKVTRPILGIKFAPDQSVEQLGVSGVLVLDAPPNGPAGKAVCPNSNPY